MPIEIQCTCGKLLKVKPELVGRKVRCPQCQQVTRVIAPEHAIESADTTPVIVEQERTSEIDPFEFDVESPPTHSNSPPPTATHQLSPRPGIVIPRSALIAISVLAALSVGYFAGREHMKAQMRSALSENLSDLKEIFSGPTAKPASPVTPMASLSLGETYDSPQFSITLNSAKIDYFRFKSIGDNPVKYQDPMLLLQFTIVNKDDRRILNFHHGNSYAPGYFQLHDDVNNTIHGIGGGFSFEIVGALRSGEDIEPGVSVTHLQVFHIPLPKTQHVLLTVNLDCLDGDDVIEYKIPAESIQQFAAHHAK